LTIAAGVDPLYYALAAVFRRTHYRKRVQKGHLMHRLALPFLFAALLGVTAANAAPDCSRPGFPPGCVSRSSPAPVIGVAPGVGVGQNGEMMAPGARPGRPGFGVIPANPGQHP